jgi:hypothetical protein
MVIPLLGSFFHGRVLAELAKQDKYVPNRKETDLIGTSPESRIDMFSRLRLLAKLFPLLI